MAPKTRENTPFYKLFISKLFTKTKIIKVWKIERIPIIKTYSISNNFDRFFLFYI